MVSREFMVRQACLNALQENMPESVRVDGAAKTLKWCSTLWLMDSVPYYWCAMVRKHFAILDRREREAADVVRLDTWREAIGSGIK